MGHRARCCPPAPRRKRGCCSPRAGLRAFGDGLVSLLLPVYLLALGHGAFEIGVDRDRDARRLGAPHARSSASTPTAPRARRCCSAPPLLMALTGVAFAAFDDFWPLLLVAFVGTLNPSSGDVSVFLPLEQAQLARTVT